MVLAAVAFPSEAEVERSNAQMLKEGRVVRARAEGGEGEAVGGVAVVEAALGTGPGEDADLSLGVLHLLRDLFEEALQGMGAARPQEAAAAGVGIDVGYGMLAQFVSVGFYPFGTTQQTGFFGAPGAVFDGPSGAVAGLD